MLPHNLPPEYLLRQPTRIDDRFRPAREVPPDRFALAARALLRAAPTYELTEVPAARPARWRRVLGRLLIGLGERLAGAAPDRRLQPTIGAD